MCLPTIITTAVAAVAAVALATPPAGEVAAPAMSSLVQLNGVAGRLPQLATTSSVCDGKNIHRALVRKQQITTSSSQGSTELLIVTFSGAVIKSGANSVGAAIKVDGVTVGRPSRATPTWCTDPHGAPLRSA